MLNTASNSVKITLELNQETNLDELMANLSTMRDSMPRDTGAEMDSLLVDFTVHEGELGFPKKVAS